MPAPVVERWGSLSATGIAKETAFGTPVAATTFIPSSGNTLDLDPGLFFPKLMMGQRDLQVFPLYGQNKNSGSINCPLFPTQGASLIAGSIGADSAPGSGVIGSSPTSATTTSGVLAPGATTVNVTSATGYAVGNFIQVDVNNTVGPTTSEVRKITTIVTNAITVDSALSFSHLSGAAVSKVVAPFTHSITQANSLPSFTVEKNLGGFESLQFAGSRINKMQLDVKTGNNEIDLSYDLQAKTVAVLGSPTAITVANELPYVFAEAAVTLFGTAVAQAQNVTLTVDNGLQATYTLNGSHDVQFLTPLTRLVTVKCDLVFTSLNDTDWGYFTKMVAQNQGAFQLTLTHPTNGGTFTFNLPQINIDTYTDAVKMEDVVMTTVSLQASLQLSSMTTISATLVNSAYLPY